MPFSQDKLDRIRTGVEHALSSGRLNAWETRFLQDMRDRLTRYGRKTTLSDKQYRLLMQLSLADAGPRDSMPRRSPRQAERWTPRSAEQRRTVVRLPSDRRRRQPWIVRRAVWETKRFAIGLVVIAIVFLIAQIDVGTLGGAWRARVFPDRDTFTQARELSVRDIQVVDGDTIRVTGDSRRVRLVGFNTPEVFSPGCSRELQIGNRASARLKELLRTAETIRFQRVACACKPGTEGTKACNYGRTCGSLYTDGRDVGDILISEGLAARYRCGRYSCPPRPGNWCG
jgi:micrococcal nuclease